MLHLVVKVCMPKMNENGGGPGVPPSTLVYLRQPHYVKRKMILLFSTKPSHIWYQIEGLEERNTNMTIYLTILLKNDVLIIRPPVTFIFWRQFKGCAM